MKTISFSPGPAPKSETAREECMLAEIDFEGTGMPASEIPHRHKRVEKMLADTRELMRELLDIPASHTPLLLEGGATGHFTALPQQLRSRSGDGPVKVGYVDGGYWSGRALAECKKIDPFRCVPHVLASSVEDDYKNIPSIIHAQQKAIDARMDYLFFNANETTNGTQVPDDVMISLGAGSYPYPIVDTTSELFSRPIDVSKFGAIVASAQKNFGNQGLTAVIVKNDLIVPCPAGVSATFDYRRSLGKLGGPPNTFSVPTLVSIYAMLKWIKDEGGVEEMEKRARIRAGLLYNILDKSGLFEGIASPAHRSLMNVIFRLRDPSRHAAFAEACEAAGIVSINGHRELNELYGEHFRISIYNGIPIEHVEYLVDTMAEFERRS